EARIKVEQDKIKEEERVKSRKAEIKDKKEAANLKKNELASEKQDKTSKENTDDIESLLNIKEAPLTDPSQLAQVDSEESDIDITSDITPEERAVITNIEQEDSYSKGLVLKQDGLVRNPTEEDSNKYRVV